MPVVVLEAVLRVAQGTALVVGQVFAQVGGLLVQQLVVWEGQLEQEHWVWLSVRKNETNLHISIKVRR